MVGALRPRETHLEPLSSFSLAENLCIRTACLFLAAIYSLASESEAAHVLRETPTTGGNVEYDDNELTAKCIVGTLPRSIIASGFSTMTASMQAVLGTKVFEIPPAGHFLSLNEVLLIAIVPLPVLACGVNTAHDKQMPSLISHQGTLNSQGSAR